MFNLSLPAETLSLLIVFKFLFTTIRIVCGNLHCIVHSTTSILQLTAQLSCTGMNECICFV